MHSKQTEAQVCIRRINGGGGGAWVLRRSLTSQVISIAFQIEREKSDKFCSEALISVWGSFTCCKSTTRDQRLYFPSEGSHTQDFYALKKSIDPGRDWTSVPVASITTGSPGSTRRINKMEQSALPSTSFFLLFLLKLFLLLPQLNDIRYPFLNYLLLNPCSCLLVWIFLDSP